MQKWVDVVVTPAQGTGKSCPDQLVEESRECSKDCPKGAPNPMAEDEINVDNRGKGKGGDADGPDIDLGSGVGTEEQEEQQQLGCLLEQEIWTPCSESCLQEKYMDEDCEKEPEVKMKRHNERKETFAKICQRRFFYFFIKDPNACVYCFGDVCVHNLILLVNFFFSEISFVREIYPLLV